MAFNKVGDMVEGSASGGYSLWMIMNREERRTVLNEAMLCRRREALAGAGGTQP